MDPIWIQTRMETFGCQDLVLIKKAVQKVKTVKVWFLLNIHIIQASTHAILALVLFSGWWQETLQKLNGGQNGLRTHVSNIVLIEVDDRHRWLCWEELVAVASLPPLSLKLGIQCLHLHICGGIWFVWKGVRLSVNLFLAPPFCTHRIGVESTPWPESTWCKIVW